VNSAARQSRYGTESNRLGSGRAGLRTAHGRSLIETLVAAFLVLTLTPVVVCAIVQGITAIAAIAVPWLAAVIITALICAAAGALVVGRRQWPRSGQPQIPPSDLPPIRRPPGIRRGDPFDPQLR
jgi:hypothetical protein